MTGFLDIPSSILVGRRLLQVVIDIHSVRLDFNGDISVLTQAAIGQRSDDENETIYESQNTHVELRTAKYLGESVVKADFRDERCTLEFGNGRSIILYLTQDRVLDVITISIEGVITYVMS